ncbi:GNAT family N-acetyltransferase [Novosphingobium kaempferiae]|uniref:GNAT family N-acetyltransferase n=1 Tax=Novosphingobium kaempferiae TaxID=2896849 RepID=UPI001E33B653|nr:GNAT family N-acetyltransferase [Novosphingobium kaempferiae]
MTDEVADKLKEMARHRGLKLVRSRRRKPGTGDFGKFGLIDDEGKKLIGVGQDGFLTASAKEIEDYLRAGAMSTWKQSASVTDRLPARSRHRAEAEEEPQPSILPRSKRRVAAAPARDRRSSVTTGKGRDTPVSGSEETQENVPLSARPKLKIVRSEPELALRRAKPADALAVARLFSQLSDVVLDAKAVARNLANLRKAGGDMYLAECGSIAGCIAWSVVATPHRGKIGRITVLVVDEGNRRRGFGTRLLAVADAALARKRCTAVEAMSDIDIRNSHNFFRSQKFEQVSYRFTRTIEKPAKASSTKR